MAMSKEAKKLRNKYAREWYSKNKERIKKQREEWWERKARELMQESEQKGGDHGEKETTQH